MTALDQAETLYLQSTFVGDVSEADIDRALTELLGSDPATELARGKLRHCLNLPHHRADPDELECFIDAAEGFIAASDRGGLAEALFWQGCYHQVLGDDNAAAVVLLMRALDLAREVDDRLVASYCLRHLGIADHIRADFVSAEQRLIESTDLRRELAFTAGVAANLVGLTYVALARGDRAAAQAYARDAVASARSAEAAKVLADAEAALEQASPRD